jgi:double stranded RNA-specific editase B
MNNQNFVLTIPNNQQFYYQPQFLDSTQFTQFINNQQFKIPTKSSSSSSSHPYLNRPKQQQQQSQQQQQKNYIQKLYELKFLNPIQFDHVSSSGPAHKPKFEMKLTLNKTLSQQKIFTSTGVSKKHAKLNCCKDALRHLTELDPLERSKYLNEADVLEIKSLFLQECCGDSTNNQFLNDVEIPTNLFTNFEPLNPPTAKKVLNTTGLSNPISVFTELLPSEAYTFNFVDEWGESHAKQFKIQLVIKLGLVKVPIIDDKVEQNIFYAIGNSKKQAKSRVTQIALENLFNLKVSLSQNSTNIVDDVKFKRFSNGISDLIKEKYLENIAESNVDTKLRTIYAAIVETSDSELSLNQAKIICLTTGTKCINGEYMSLNGEALNDCHAEILACRLLKRYLYEQLDVYINFLLKKITQQTCIDDLLTSENFIFERKDEYDDEDDDVEGFDDRKVLFRLKDNIKFHLFISTTPCGDGRIFAPHDNHDGIDNHPNRKIRGLLRAKLESGEGTIPVANDNVKLQTWDAILHGERLKVMSCSDKLCKLNVVGVQGALLSHFIDAVYFDSLIIGSYYHYDHLSRALYGRIEDVSKKKKKKNFFF